MCKVSVIIPVYDVEKYLSSCLDSVLGQTLKDIEVIAVDDASHDGSAKILERYAKEDERLKVISLKENHRQGYARNRGLELAEGKYVYFLDSDDMITAEALEKLYEEAESERLDVIYFDSDVVFESEDLKAKNDNYIRYRSGKYPSEVVTGLRLFDLFMLEEEWLVYVQRQFWRREFLISNQAFFPEGIEHEDEFFSFKATILAERAKYLREKFFIRRYRANSVMTREWQPRDFSGYFITYSKMIEFMDERDIVSYGANMHVLILFELLKGSFDPFDHSQDPADWFNPEEQAQYRMLKYMLKNIQDINDRDLMFWRAMDRYDNIWIYGAGRIATTTARRLLETRHDIAGFIVTEKRDNPESIFSRKVMELSEITDIGKNGIVLVALGRTLHEEVAALLKERGFDYFLYADNELRGPFLTH